MSILGRLSFFWTAVFSLALWAATTGHALAAAKGLVDSLEGPAKSSYDSAKLLYSDHDYEGASAKFHHSYELSHDARLLWNMAACEKALRHYARATALVERYLQEGDRLLSADDRSRAQGLLESMSEFSSRVRLKDAPAKARVLVDGVEVGRVPIERLVLDVGSRKLRVEAVGFLPFETTLDVPGATELTVVVQLKPEAAPAGQAGLSVLSHGSQDTIYVDGRVVGEGSVEVTLPPGTHKVRVAASGKKAFEQELELKPGEHRRLQVTLKSSGSGRAWPWVIGGAAVIAGGVVGGVLLASPQEGTFPAGSLGPAMPLPSNP